MLKKIGGIILIVSLLQLISCSTTKVAKDSKTLENERWGQVSKNDYRPIFKKHREAVSARNF